MLKELRGMYVMPLPVDTHYDKEKQTSFHTILMDHLWSKLREYLKMNIEDSFYACSEKLSEKASLF